MTVRFPAALRFLGVLTLLWVAVRLAALTGPGLLFPPAAADDVRPRSPQVATAAALPVGAAEIQAAPRPRPAPAAIPAAAPRITPAALAALPHRSREAASDAPSSPPAPPSTPTPDGGAAAEAAYAAVRAGDRRAADAAFTRALALTPDDPRATAWRADRAWLHRRWSGMAYALVGRGGGAIGLGARPQLGGSQLGGRLGYRLDPLSSSPIDVTARLNAPLDDGRSLRRGAQAAVGVEWRPNARVPGGIAVERYIAVGRQARDAFAIRASGGVHERAFGPVLFSAYVEAGMVGLASRDLFVDGSGRASLPLPPPPLSLPITIQPAIGMWGGAQPGVRRLDVGPSVTAQLRLDNIVIAADLDWRQRVAGNARPASGPALTVRTGF